MSDGTRMTRRFWILVKAYPQPSQQYEETVCCAGISEDLDFLARLYPIRFRHLPKEKRFHRYDLVEARVWKAESDPRPESYKVDEPSIKIVRSGSLPAEQRTRLWLPFLSPSIKALEEEQKTNGRSLGIVRPDKGTLRFKAKPVSEASAQEKQATTDLVRSQQALLEESVPRLPSPEYVFLYTFKCGGHQHTMQIHDWEVQHAWFRFKKQYKDESVAMEKLKAEYSKNIPNQNLHFIMGTKQSRPWQFMIIGLLRSTIGPDELESAGQLF